MRIRQRMLILFGIVTLGLVCWVDWRDATKPSVVAAPTRIPRTAGTPSATLAAPEQRKTNTPDTELVRDPLLAAKNDPFKVVNFAPPAPKPVPPPPMAVALPTPPKPTAPPLPFQYFGSMVDVNGKAITYLSRNGEVIPIKEKEVLDNGYRIETISKTQITLTYLALNEVVVIPIRSAEE